MHGDIDCFHPRFARIWWTAEKQSEIAPPIILKRHVLIYFIDEAVIGFHRNAE